MRILIAILLSLLFVFNSTLSAIDHYEGAIKEEFSKLHGKKVASIKLQTEFQIKSGKKALLVQIVAKDASRLESGNVFVYVPISNTLRKINAISYVQQVSVFDFDNDGTSELEITSRYGQGGIWMYKKTLLKINESSEQVMHVSEYTYSSSTGVCTLDNPCTDENVTWDYVVGNGVLSNIKETKNSESIYFRDNEPISLSVVKTTTLIPVVLNPQETRSK